MAEAGVEIPRSFLRRGDFRAASGRRSMEGLLALRARPSAVFAENDLMAIGVLSAAHAAGVDVPGELSVMGFDGIAFGADVTPGLTTIAQPTRDVAATTAQLLFERLAARDLPPQRVELPVSLVLRGSTGAAARADHPGPRPDQAGDRA
jgi:DNA-binding LacI/PurR family transcriptional regulator